MKYILYLLFFSLPLIATAEEGMANDTTIYLNERKIVINEDDNKIKVSLYEQTIDGETIENEKIFEGVYLDGQSSEQRFAGMNVPFARQRHHKEKHRNTFDGHICGIYFGFTRLSDGLNYSNVDDIDLILSKSWEFGFNIFDNSLPISRNQEWGFVTGLGWGYSRYRLDSNQMFNKVDGITEICVPGDDFLKRSQLHYFHIRVPVVLEWQRRINGRGPFFASFGPELEVRHTFKSKVKYGDGQKEKIKDLNNHPVTVNLLLQMGFGDWGIYTRYSPFHLFKKNKGPEVHPISFGIMWYL